MRLNILKPYKASKTCPQKSDFIFCVLRNIAFVSKTPVNISKFQYAKITWRKILRYSTAFSSEIEHSISVKCSGT